MSGGTGEFVASADDRIERALVCRADDKTDNALVEGVE